MDAALKSFDSLGEFLDLTTPSQETVRARQEKQRSEAEQSGKPVERPEIGLTGGNVVNSPILKEKAVHRLMVVLSAYGNKPEEVANLTDYSVAQVRHVLAQPWARQQLARILEDETNMVPLMIKSAATKSIQILDDIQSDIEAPAGARVSAARDLLDRFLGKPVQSVKMEVTKPQPTSMEELDQQLKELRDIEKDLIGRPKVREVPTVNLTLVPSSAA